MNIIIILILITTHWVADFVRQTHKMAIGKSKNWGDLLEHTAYYSVLFLFVTFIIADIQNLHVRMLFFAPITFVCHTATDYYTSRVNSALAQKAREDDNWHDFFVAIGFDQLLHYAQLLITFKLLM